MQLRSRVTASERRDERGSLIVVLAVLLVLGLICTAIAFQVVGNQENVLAKSNSASSISAADAGLSDAMFRLDQLSPATSGPFCMDSNGKQVTITAVGVPVTVTCAAAPGDLSGVGYTAIPQDSAGTQWLVQSKATVNKIAGSVQETVNYSAKYPYALFGNSGLDFNGQNPGGLGAYTEDPSSPNNPDTSVAHCSGGGGTSCVKVGSNGPIKCAGGLASNVSEVYYTGGGGAGNCANPLPDPSRYVLTIPQAPAGVLAGCPWAQGAAVNGIKPCELGSAYGVGSIGTAGQATTYYISDQPVWISGTLQVLGSVSLYIILDPTTDNSMISGGMQTLYIAGGSEVNTAFDGTAGPPATNTTLPAAENLQIMTNSTGTVGSANGGGANGPYTFGGVLYAPQANLVGNGCKSAYYGSVTINTLTCNGGPHLQVYYDNKLGTLYGPPLISGYSQTNPQNVNVP